MTAFWKHILFLQYYWLAATYANSIRGYPDFVKEYLTKYGYLKRTDDTKIALRNFQWDVGLSPSGIVTESAILLMRRPRCGNLEDKARRGARKSRQKRFVPHSSKWSRTVLKWKLVDPENLLKSSYDNYIVRNTIHRAFADWSMGSKRVLEFEEIKDHHTTPDITVLFADGDHNDTLPFDGNGGIVAHGFYPTEGKLHFDGAEKWTLNMPRGINLYQTAMHEIGHLLGLKHSTDHRAVMFPINRPYDPNYHLGDDDVRGIRYLYTPWSWNHFLNKYLAQLWRNVGSKSSFNKMTRHQIKDRYPKFS